MRIKREVTDNPCKLLLIDPDPADAELTSKLITQALSDCQLVVVTDAVAFAEQLAAGGFTTVISEQDLGWAQGIDVLTAFYRQHPGTRRILFASLLPANIHSLQQQAKLSAYLRKNSAGFLELPNIVKSGLEETSTADYAIELWSRTVRNLSEPALTLLTDGRVLEANMAAAATLGYDSPETLAGLRLLSLFEFDPQALSGNSDLLGRLEALGNGQIDALDLYAAPLRDIQKIGRQRLKIWSVSNSGRLALLYQGDTAMPAKPVARGAEYKDQYEQLLYAVSHDLQEPLQLVSRHADLLADVYKNALDENGIRFIQNLAKNAHLMQSMLDDLLDYSRIGRLESVVTEVDLNVLVDEVTELYSSKLEELGGQVKTSGLPTVLADRGQMLRLFQNLVSNAIKFHGQESLIITISAAVNNDAWELIVKDNGIGIEPQQTDKIFNMFKRLHTQQEIPGNGMGLALCERIVRAHGGRIWANSRGDQNGMVFHFTLGKTGLQKHIIDQQSEPQEGMSS